MLFHLPKFPAEIRISHLNARVNEQRKRIAQTTASRLELLQLVQQLAKEAKIRKKNDQKIYVLDFKGDVQASAVDTIREEITLILATLVALEHFYIMYLETFATQSAATSRVFNMSQEELRRDSVNKLFKNQGVYNGLIAVFLLYGVFTGSITVVTIFLLNVIFAALYGSLTADKKIILTQGGLAILALLSLLF